MLASMWGMPGGHSTTEEISLSVGEQQVFSPDNATSHTLSSYAPPTTAPLVVLAVFFSNKSNGSVVTITSATWGGETGVVDEQAVLSGAEYTGCAFVSFASPPSGHTGDVVLTYSGTMWKSRFYPLFISGLTGGGTKADGENATSSASSADLPALVTTSENVTVYMMHNEDQNQSGTPTSSIANELLNANTGQNAMGIIGYEIGVLGDSTLGASGLDSGSSSEWAHCAAVYE